MGPCSFQSTSNIPPYLMQQFCDKGRKSILLILLQGPEIPKLIVLANFLCRYS